MRTQILTNKQGQASVEAAFMLPVLLVLLLILLQPGIILYDRIVMNDACMQTARFLSTSNSASAQASVEQFAKNRLGAIPEQKCFHVHSPTCSYEIATQGNEASSTVEVSITNYIEPLPLFNTAANFLGMLDDEGRFKIVVTQTASVQPSWVQNSESGTNPEKWAGAWLHEN